MTTLDHNHNTEPCDACPTTSPTEVIRIIFTTEDVRDMAEEYEIDPDVAISRVLEWGRHIEGTMSGYCSEQLASVIKYDQP